MGESRAGRIEALFVLHYEPLLRFAHLVTGGAGGEDLVQDAFVRALQKWPQDAAPEAFRAWAQTTLLRRHLSGVRRVLRERAAVARLPDPEAGGASDGDLAAAIRRLPPRQRAAVVLRYFEDLPEAEVARRLGCRLGTAKALLHQARRRLQVEPLLAGERA